jgi:phage shock protein A
MWKRFTRALRSLFGGAVAAMEDPKLILEQNIRDMQDQVPKMNNNIATIKANVSLLEKELAKLKSEETDLLNKAKAAIGQGRDDIAGNFAVRLEKTRSAIGSVEPQLGTARAAYDKAVEVKKVFMRETERKIKEAQDALRAHERAQMQAKVADALESFEVAGIDQTHNEMINRINEKTAKNEARVDIALDSVDTSGLKIEEEAEKLRAADLVSQLKLEMGQTNINSPSSTSDSDATKTGNKDSLGL